MIKSIVAGNWKMNKTPSEGNEFSASLINKLNKINNTDVIICPPFTGLTSLIRSDYYDLGAQNCFFQNSGAFTGEISVEMLIDCNVKYVILGHSERRTIFGENDEFIRDKVSKVIDSNIIPILCIGETIEQLNEGLAKETIYKQLKVGLSKVDSLKNIVIAYEPVWAIGTGLTASIEKVEEIHAYIRGLLNEFFDEDGSSLTPILYGGSVNSDNAKELINVKYVNGFLIGGASLSVEKFTDIIKIVDNK
ncbi:MAG: triose-phosphate isomerase [Candidatus Neomarinimicrobiota bacterium]